MSPDARREHLLAAAIRTMAARGIGNTRHSDVATEAGVAVPTTFHYFPTKSDLITAVVEETSRFLLEEIVAPILTRAESAPNLIECILMTFCDAIDTHPAVVRVWLEWSVSIREGLWDSYLVFYRKALAAIADAIERGRARGEINTETEADDAARVVVGLAHMIVQMKFSGSSRDQIDHTVHSLVHGYLAAPARVAVPDPA